MKLSVLDQSTAVSGRPQTDAIADSLALARHCDGLGYHRYWVSEHHHSGSIVGSAPHGSGGTDPFDEDEIEKAIAEINEAIEKSSQLLK